MAVKWAFFAEQEGYESVRDMLFDLYHRKGMTSTQISKLLKCHNKTVCEKMKELGIPIRERAASKGQS